MPIFEYKCAECGSKFEKLIRRADAAEVACPTCGNGRVSQEFSTFAARANGVSKEPAMPACPGGMCRTPDLCGRN